MNYPLLTVRGPDFGLLALPVAYAESGEGYTERDDGPATEATRVCYVPWQQSQAFRQAILPLVAIGPAIDSDHASRFVLTDRPNDSDLLDGFTYNTAIRKQVLRLDPEPHPRKTWLRAVSAVVTGIGAVKMDPTGKILFRDNQNAGFLGLPDDEGVAQIVVTYRKLPYKVGASNDFANVHWLNLRQRIALHGERENPGCELPRYVSREYKPASDSYTIQGGTNSQLQEFGGASTGGRAFGKLATWVARDTSVITENLSKVQYKCHIVYTWHMVPGIPRAAGRLIGCVNDYANFDFQALTPVVGDTRFASDMLYEYPEIGDPYPMVDGTIVRDIKYHMLYRRPGHNYVFRSSLVRSSPVRPVLPLFFEPLGSQEFAGWTLAFRRLVVPADASWNATIDENGQLGFRPGDTIYRYADLNSLFQLNDLGID